MKTNPQVILISHDTGLLAHWRQAFGSDKVICSPDLQILAQMCDTLLSPQHEERPPVWLDASLPDLPLWTDARWKPIFSHYCVICASSKPENDAAILALDAGCMAYCHAFSDAKTLNAVLETVKAGHTWVGQELMQQLVAGAMKAAKLKAQVQTDWDTTLTEREKEIAILAANGASNHAIAVQCGITERTVKAHISSTFEKLNLTDRLQLALKVHGIN